MEGATLFVQFCIWNPHGPALALVRQLRARQAREAKTDELT